MIFYDNTPPNTDQGTHDLEDLVDPAGGTMPRQDLPDLTSESEIELHAPASLAGQATATWLAQHYGREVILVDEAIGTRLTLGPDGPAAFEDSAGAAAHYAAQREREHDESA